MLSNFYLVQDGQVYPSQRCLTAQVLKDTAQQGKQNKNSQVMHSWLHGSLKIIPLDGKVLFKGQPHITSVLNSRDRFHNSDITD